ncbi:hypothetical protein CMO90_02545 [Candidatus Woesearchaeota archaeon]|jgi:hypothetical protein|nr:hypothetical protein [Candidatus Woesearchaeota archaeon]|tara:strand:- start:327 stop:692 length:366 start_codon:yes stop_codon:yes gene_type:complete
MNLEQYSLAIVLIVAIVAIIGLILPVDFQLSTIGGQAITQTIEPKDCTEQKYCADWGWDNESIPNCLDYGFVEYKVCNKYSWNPEMTCNSWNFIYEEDCIDWEMDVSWDRACKKWKTRKVC